MDKLSEVVSKSTRILMAIPSDRFTGDDTEMDQQSGSQGSYQSGRRPETSLVDLRDRDVKRGKRWDLVQILESRRQTPFL